MICKVGLSKPARIQVRSLDFSIALVFLLLQYFFTLAPLSLFAQAADSKEYQLKAAILDKFLGFIEWENNDNNEEKNICVLGRNPFGDTLTRLASIQNRNIRVNVQNINLTSDNRYCHLLFISSSERQNLPQILSNLKASPVVTVSDINGFAADGGTIELIIEEQRYVRFIIKTRGAKEKGIRLSSQLLALAKSILVS